MNLQKIREAYWENLRLYNDLFPINFERQRTNWGNESIEEFSDRKKIENMGKALSLLKNLEKKEKEFKKRADQSGNSQIWRRGEPLDNLSQDLRERIEKALNLGI